MAFGIGNHGIDELFERCGTTALEWDNLRGGDLCSVILVHWRGGRGTERCIFIETLLNGTTFPARPTTKSDFAISRDNRSACEWQSFVNNQEKAQAMFQFVFHDLSILGQDINSLVDCTEVVPVPAPVQGVAHFPAGKTINDVDLACGETPFPDSPDRPWPGNQRCPSSSPKPVNVKITRNFG
ncbi:hypothetical protein NUW54_g6614 [Trametes sanguinea]|uniref:Uncharacterized protein n=1 Tax=Trametes sanguinea TaxID=158606 RepID=A0ACC1PUB4_9APHY|nr:hypothetical protein NUW54_g6614 [Trametes sanguinea]